MTSPAGYDLDSFPGPDDLQDFIDAEDAEFEAPPMREKLDAYRDAIKRCETDADIDAEAS